MTIDMFFPQGVNQVPEFKNMVFKDSESLKTIEKQALEIKDLKSQLEIQAGPTDSPEIQKQDEPEPEPVETPKVKPQVKLEDKPEPAPESKPVSALAAKRSELEKDRRVLSLIYASLPAGQSRSDCRKEMTKIDCRLKAISKS